MKPLPTPPSRTEQVYLAIVDEICEGRLAPGAHLVQEDLATSLGVSRQPVQQAMAMLRRDGLVRELGARGLHVAPIEPGEMAHHYQLRAALDALAARLAAERPEAARTSFAVEGRGLIADGRAALGGPVARLVACDVAFHGFLYTASGNPLIASAAEAHWRYLRRVMGEVLRHAAPAEDIWDEHQAILDAVLAGDADTAARTAEAHVERAASSLATALAAGADAR